MKTDLDKQMQELAEKTGLVHDGGDDNRLFNEDTINVFASDMTKKQYDYMEKDINNTVINRRLYTVYAWNDCSGYKYWTQSHNESNYIQVSVHIKTKNVHKIDVEKLKEDVQNLFDRYSCDYDNTDYHDFSNGKDD